MRTNIELDDDLLAEATRLSALKTKRAVVEEALRTYVQMRTEEERRRRYEAEYERLRPELAKIRITKSSLDILREDRERE